MFNDKILKSVAEAVKAVMDEALKGDQHKIDKNKNGKVDAHDFKLLRKEEAPKKPASPFDWKNTPRQTAEKGEKTGHDSKKISTGTVYTKRYTKEEVEQLDELSKNTLKSYSTKAKKDSEEYKKAGYSYDSDPDERAFAPWAFKKAASRAAGAAKADSKIKEEASQEEFNKEIKKAQDKSTGKIKADVAKPAVQAVKQESVEQIDELSKKTLGKYINKAQGRVRYAAHDVGHHLTTLYRGRETAGNYRRLKNSTTGIQRAVDRLTREEVEQIDELSKTTLGSYIKKAVARQANREQNIASVAYGDQPEKKADQRRNAREMRRDQKEIIKRDRGVKKAVKRLVAKPAVQAVQAVKQESVEQIKEGRPSQSHPLEGHDYHKKTDAELKYIAKDAHEAAEAMKSHNTTAENKYRDQANDSATVRYWRQKNGTPDWYKKKYGHIKEEVEHIEERSLSTGEKAAMEKNVKGMKKSLAGFKERYGKDAKSVMYATATKQAKGE